jgi:hypothetical protein
MTKKPTSSDEKVKGKIEYTSQVLMTKKPTSSYEIPMKKANGRS